MKKITLLFCLLVAAQLSRAAGFPQISSGEQEYWYYLKFTQGTFVVASQGDGAVCKALVPTGRDAQLWKVEGGSTTGYFFTNKLGQSLYVTGTAQGTEVLASANPSSQKRFKINTRGSNYTITPFANVSQAFNVWGGMGLRGDIKLYNSSDANAPIEFIAEDALQTSNTAVNVVPYPASVTMGDGVYDLHQLKGIKVPAPLGPPRGGELSGCTLLAERLKEDLYRAAGIDVRIKTDETAEWVGAALIYDETLGEEAYELSITSDGIMLKAADYGGFFNGLQTLRQLMPPAIFGNENSLNSPPHGGSRRGANSKPSSLNWTLPCLTIRDEPAMHHRGFHLDISRHFFDKQEVKKLLDAASVYKLNRFHWHLTDDQGWRVEIPEYPRLTTVGAIRKASLTVSDQSGNKFFDDTEYGRGCFYTLDDLREIVAYAAERNIQIIPEIDMPGHMTACIVAYPELGCNPEKKIEVMTEGGVSRDILNVGKTETLDFLKCVMGHLAEVFPYELVHIGGDECPTTAWESNSDCAKLIKNEGLSGVKDLQAWLVEQLGTFLRENYGKTVVVWDELLANWNSAYKTHPVVMSWRGVDYARQAADKGFQSIVVPTSPLYFDYLQANRDQLEIDCPYNAPYGTINTVEKVYNFDPRSTVKGREQYVLGTQANLWTESCTSNREAEYQYYPRLLALSEIAWLPTEKKDFLGFYNRLQHHAAVLEAKDITYAPHYFDPAELSPAEQAIAEAEDILRQTVAGAVSYPSAEEVDALQAALDALQASEGVDGAYPADKLSALNTQLSTFKAAPITLPKGDRLYKIVSASTYFRNRFNGSSLYTKSGALALHYTQQTEPEEAWQFLPQDGGTFQIVSALTGKAITLSKSIGQVAKADQPDGTALTIRKAIAAPTLNSKHSTLNTYFPGVINIKNGRSNLFANLQGAELTIVSSTDSTLCYPGTWRIEEITDYRPWLQKLVAKAERLLEDAQSQPVPLPSAEALTFLGTEVIADGQTRLQQDEVTQQDYLDITAAYARYLSMGIIDFMDTSCYYLIRNAFFDTYYAAANANTNGVLPKTFDDTDAFRWYFVPNADGTTSILNKQTQTPAYVEESADGKRIRLGKEYPWKLQQVTTDEGNTAIAIMDCSGAYSWYTNPRSWTYLLLKPYDLSGSVWELIKTEELVTDGIRDVKNEGVKSEKWNGAVYDLSGRQIVNKNRKPGIYIQNRTLICQ